MPLPRNVFWSQYLYLPSACLDPPINKGRLKFFTIRCQHHCGYSHSHLALPFQYVSAPGGLEGGRTVGACCVSGPESELFHLSSVNRHRETPR